MNVPDMRSYYAFIEIQPIDGNDDDVNYVWYRANWKTFLPKIEAIRRYFQESYRKNKVAFVISNMCLYTFACVLDGIFCRYFSCIYVCAVL